MAGRTIGTKKSTKPQAAKTVADVKKDGYVCSYCGTTYKSQKGNFNPTRSELYRYNNGFTHVCKKCSDDLYAHYVKALGGERQAIKRLCMKWDIFYSDKLADTAISKSADEYKFQTYIRIVYLNQNAQKGTTFDDYLMIEDENDNKSRIVLSQKDISESMDPTNEMIEFWGSGLPPEDYFELDERYQDWTSRHECQTAAQERLFKSLAMTDIALKKAYRDGDIKRIKDAVDMQQGLMASANIKPNQKNESIGNELTYGQWIQKWEDEKPIPEPDPTWADVDGIGHYVRVWLLGPILNMFKLKNPYKDEFEEEIAKYTAHRPEYVEDSDDGTIKEQIFSGIENIEE